MLSAVLFDFDGVIANSEPLHFRAFREVLAGEGLTLSESDYYARYLGFSDAGAFEAIAGDRGVAWSPAHISSMVDRKAVRMEELERHESVLFPGASTVIRRLAAGCTLGVVSGALRAEILRVLDHEQLTSAFSTVVGSEDTAKSKPAPDPYLRALELLSIQFGRELDPRTCVAIEDSRWGLESARAAGLRTVGVTHTYSAQTLQSTADVVIPQLDVLTFEFLRKIAQRTSD